MIEPKERRKRGIEERKEEDPNQVDQVPEQADTFECRVVIWAKFAALQTYHRPNDQRHPDQDVNPVKTRHHKVEREVQSEVRRNFFGRNTE